MYNHYVDAVPFNDRKLLLDIEVKEKKGTKKTAVDATTSIKKPVANGVVVEEAKGHVIRLLAQLNTEQLSRDVIANITLDLVHVLTEQRFSSNLEAYTDLSNNLKLQKEFRPHSFYQVITHIIKSSNGKVKILGVRQVDVNLSLTFLKTIIKVDKFEDSEEHHLHKRILMLIPAKAFAIVRQAVFNKGSGPKTAETWVKRLIVFFKTIETNDGWVSTLSNYTERLDKVSTAQLVFVAQREYMKTSLGLDGYKSHSETIED